ncbi:MAG: transketolase [Nitrospirota bacterium]|nr:transketolase [Nitrospirota bacterium]
MPASTTTDVATLEQRAKEIRRDVVRMIGAAKSGHPGGSLSATDLITALYFAEMNHDPAKPEDPNRDRFILSKGHGVPAQYAAMAHAGYFDRSKLNTLRQMGSPLQGHPERGRMPGLEASTGSLGQGVSIAQGMAMAAKMDGQSWRVYTLIGDGEANEGQIWEAAMSAAHFKLGNLVCIMDCNGIQLDGFVKDILDMGDVAEKWRSFGWNTIEIDGHNMQEILDAFEAARKVTDKPTAIVAHTVKGKGVSFMENNPGFHGVAPTPDEVEQALKELA